MKGRKTVWTCGYELILNMRVRIIWIHLDDYIWRKLGRLSLRLVDRYTITSTDSRGW